MRFLGTAGTAFHEALRRSVLASARICACELGFDSQVPAATKLHDVLDPVTSVASSMLSGTFTLRLIHIGFSYGLFR